MSKAKEYWKARGKNFMTPDVIEYITTRTYLVELSEGRGFRDDPIYRVSVATLAGEREYDLSQMFYSESAAREYIESELI